MSSAKLLGNSPVNEFKPSCMQIVDRWGHKRKTTRSREWVRAFEQAMLNWWNLAHLELDGDDEIGGAFIAPWYHAPPA